MKTYSNIINFTVGIITVVLFIIIIHDVNKLKVEQEIKDSLWTDMYYSVIDSFEKEAYLVTVTTWNPTKAQCDNSPDRTACNFKIDTINPYKQRIIGLSRDLLQDFYYGEKVKLENCGRFNGYYTVVDCGAKRLVRTVDICIGRNVLGGKFKNAVLKHTND